MSKYPSQMQDKFNLRFPDGMREAIAARAKRHGRSMNSEIIKILDDALRIESDVDNSELFIDYRAERGEKPLPKSFKEAARKMMLALEEFEAAKESLIGDISEESSSKNP